MEEKYSVSDLSGRTYIGTVTTPTPAQEAAWAKKQAGEHYARAKARGECGTWLRWEDGTVSWHPFKWLVPVK